MMTNLLFSQLTAIGKRFAMVLTMLLIVGIGQAWGAETTVSWTATSGALGSAIGSEGGTATGTISTGAFIWNYTRTLVALKSGKSDHIGMSGEYMQVGSSNAGETLRFTTSNILGVIQSVTVDCWSKDGAHQLDIIVGGNSYYSGETPNAAGNTKSGTGTSSGLIDISFSISKKNALYVKSITIVYEATGGGNTGDDNIDEPIECDEYTYELVTDVDELSVGDNIIIVAAATDRALSTNQKTNNRGEIEITKTNEGNTIRINSDVQVLTIENGIKSNTFAFRDTDGNDGYLYAASSSDNYLKTKQTLDENGSWSVSIISTGVATIKAQGTNTHNWLRYNAGSSLFSCYASGMADVAIYKQCTAETTQLATPTGLNVTNITSTSATLSWGEVANASSYTVQVLGEDDEVIAEYPGLTENTKTVSELDPETNYVFGVVAVGDGITYTNSSQAVSDVFTTSAAASPATITLSELGVTSTIDTYSVGDQYTLPKTSSQSCDGKQLVGWSTVEVAETNTKPTSNYYELDAEVTLAETQTFYAVFATAGEGGVDNTDYSNVHTSNVTLTDEGGTNATDSKVKIGGIDYTAVKAGTGSAMGAVNITVPSGTTKLSFHMVGWNGEGNKTISLSGATADPSSFKTVADAGVSGNSTTYTLSGTIADYFYSTTLSNINTETTLTFSNGGADQRFVIWGVNASTGGGVSYSAYTTSCVPTYSITYDFAGGTGSHCSNTSVPQGDPYTICDEAPTKEGHTFLGWSDGTNTYAAGATITPTKNTTLTAQWQINTYTVTWSNNGATTPVDYNHGDALVVPTAASCDGVKEFVGWTEDNTFTYHATTPPSDLFTEKTATVTADATYYAVFAAPSGNAGDGDYVKLTETPADLSGEYLIVYEDSKGSPAAPKAFNGGLETLDAASNTISVTIDGNTIESTDATDAAKFTIAKDGEGDYTIKSTSGKYIGRTADDNKLDEHESTPYKNTITFTDGNVNIIASGGAYLRYNKNSGAERFRYYKSDTYTGQQPIALYKKSGSSASYTDYTTGCHDVTITYYGFTGGYTTNCGGSDLNVITTRVNSSHTIPNCGNITDPTDLGRTFLNLWKDQNGKVHQPGETFIVTQDITLYAQWKLETTGDIELPADKEDLATTDIVVTGGKTLTIPEGETITINSLTLKGGLLGEDSNSGYAMPSVVIPDGATLVRKNTTINLDLVVNSDSWYPFAVPFALDKNDNIDYLDPVLKAASTYNTHFAIKTYDGENRAKVGTDQENNWDKVLQTAGLQPGKGYIISAMTYPDKDTATIRIPMSVSNDWLADGEQESITVKEQTTTRNQVTVTAYTGDAATEHQRHAGWNFVANPYLSMFAGGNVANDVEYIKGSINIQDKYTYEDTEVTYVTVPAYNFAYYEQFKLSATKLNSEYSFFVQVGTDGTMTFETAGRQQAPAHLAARAAEQPIKMDVDITLSDDNHSDQTGLIICDRFSDAYEIGHDLEKMFGSAYNLSVYTLMADNTPLAFQALAIQNSMQVIPIGYRTPAQGEYTFALNEATSDIELLNEQYEQLILVDYETGALTNMLNNEYTFYSDRTQSNNRFALYAVPRQNTTTDLPNAIGNEEVKKVIYNDHFYILRNGKVFNGAGQIVK